MFPIKATIYTLIVAAFVPAGFHAAPDGAFAEEATRIAAEWNGEGQAPASFHTVNTATSDFCAQRREACQVAGELGEVAGFVFSMAADRAEDALESHSRRAPANVQDTVLTADELFAEAAGEIPTR